jgi:hypothetical protein
VDDSGIQWPCCVKAVVDDVASAGHKEALSDGMQTCPWNWQITINPEAFSEPYHHRF